MSVSNLFTFKCLLIVTLSVLLASQLTTSLTPDERVACTRGLVCSVKKDTLDFLAVGDTGGISFDISNHLKFLGITTPTQTQLGVALAMAHIAGQKPLDFVMNLGDNIYWNGAASVDDFRFKAVFENPYSDKRLQVPWYMIAGNHDHLGSVPAQIAYTQKSNKWTFPNYYYKASYAFGTGKQTTVDFIFIDTIVLCGQTIDVDGKTLFNWVTANFKVPEKPEKKHEKMAVEQWKWLEQQLKESTADYIFVSGHYPVYTIASRGTKCLINKLDPLMRKYNVTAYFSGHDHSLQYFHDDGKKSGSEMHYIVSGCGSRIGAWGLRVGVGNVKLVYWYPTLSVPITELGVGLGGFVGVSVNSTQATFKFYGNGILTMKTASARPRTSKK
ncbi:Tartrate-resistant acid phosphatase type 5 [Aphelenchoides bicaudatus]|nr:Tartrate-resistant acid phosphatase type 5 [Aphelenchoides bicaudatus]